jgi:MYXO-CTERM domain-containing protein
LDSHDSAFAPEVKTMRLLAFTNMLIVLLLVPCKMSFADQKPCGTEYLRSIVGFDVPQFHGPFEIVRDFPAVGDKRDLWTYDLSVMPPKNVAIPATCRAVGEHIAVWVADEVTDEMVTDDELQAVVSALETQTPRLPEMGIVDNNEELFGKPPVFAEGDPDLTLFIYDIAGYNNYEFDGFFRREDLQPFMAGCENSPMSYCSNELGMVHVNADGIGTDYMNGVIAHEFEHLAHFGHDSFEENWLDESMAELAMAYSGYDDPGNNKAYTDNPALPLVIEPPVHYGACFMFGAYLFDLVSATGIKELVAAPKKGLDSIDNLFPDLGGFNGIFGKLAPAMVLDDPDSPSGPFGLTLYDPPKVTTFTFGSTASKDYTVGASALKFVELNWQLENLEAYSLTISPASSPVVAHVVHPDSGMVYEMSTGHPLELPVLDDPRIIFALANTDTLADSEVTIGVELVEGTVPEPVVEEPSTADVISQTDTVGPEEIAANETIGNGDSGAGSPDTSSVEPDTSTFRRSGCGVSKQGSPLLSALLFLMVLLALAGVRRRSTTL